MSTFRPYLFAFLLLTFVIGSSLAWMNPSLMQKPSRIGASSAEHDATTTRFTVADTPPHGSTAMLVTNRIDDQQSSPPSSRRQWFSQVTSSAAAGLVISQTVTAPSHAATASSSTLARPTPALCDPSVSVWQNSKTGRFVYLVGTAHISSQSAMLAGDVVHDVSPRAVFVELDAKRIGAAAGGKTGSGSDKTSSNIQVRPITGSSTFQQEETSAVPTATSGVGSNSGLAWAATDPGSLDYTNDGAPTTAPPTRSNPFDLRQRAMQAASTAVGNAIRGMYKKLDTSGFKPGEEFVMAVREGQKVGATIVLGDRDVEVTLRRLTQALAETDLNQLMSPDSDLERSMQELLPSGSPSPNSSDADFKDEMTQYVEVMKAKENVKKIMSQLQKAAPKLYEALVAERDVYMASGLDQLNQFSTIVAVMGIAHVDGVETYLQGHGWKPMKLRCPKR